MLVALPQSPARLRPDRHGLAAIAGRKKVLDRMVAEGVVTQSDVNVAEHEGVPSIRLAMPMIAPHLAYHLMTSAKTARIETNIDANLQQAIERLAVQESAYFDDHASLAVQVG